MYVVDPRRCDLSPSSVRRDGDDEVGQHKNDIAGLTQFSEPIAYVPAHRSYRRRRQAGRDGVVGAATVSRAIITKTSEINEHRGVRIAKRQREISIAVMRYRWHFGGARRFRHHCDLSVRAHRDIRLFTLPLPRLSHRPRPSSAVDPPRCHHPRSASIIVVIFMLAPPTKPSEAQRCRPAVISVITVLPLPGRFTSAVTAATTPHPNNGGNKIFGIG